VAPPILANLDSDQQEAVKKTEGPNLILAGAGSGKTRVLTYKVAYLILEKKTPAQNILMVTFTNKAAGEMKGRVWKYLDKGSQLPFMGTFHSFCARLLRAESEKTAFSKNFSIYDEADQLDLVKEVLSDLQIGGKSRPQAILAAISAAKGELLGPDDYKKLAYGYFAQIVSEVYPKYQKQLLKNNALDFDDLISETVKLLKRDGEIGQKYQRRFRYILVDEYQDVNTAQYELTKILAGFWGNITVVGDACQAIYGFRGADFRNILNFEKDFKNVTVFNLTQNYRSTQAILDSAFSVISQNESHPILKLWTKNKGGKLLEIFEAENEVEEAGFVLTQIKESYSPLSSFAVLYRTNAQSRVLEEACLQSGIPYVLVGGTRFYQRKEIKDVLSYLRVIVNPKDSVSQKRIEKIGKGRLKKFEKVKEKIRKNQKPQEIIENILKETEYLFLIDDGTEKGKSRVENVKELLSVASNFENLSDFLENVSLVEAESEAQKAASEGKEAITLMTVHAAKGLEFETVFLVGMEEGLFPHLRSSFDPADLEEERRLAYVGITRAKEKLYLTYARNRLFLGRRQTSVVSRFVTDIPDHLISKA
jgi:DNA helicase-2/ATP-dependent DNA helicase PcrA